MNRKIKFRAWDQKKKEMLYGVSPFALLISDEKAPLLSPKASRNEDCVFEQYTGLKDKNGKEIYEGDIVALLFGYVPMKSVTTENIRIENAQKAVIRFDTARAAFRYTIKLRTPKDCQFKPGTETNMVVIGNIHEDGGLLNDKD